MGLFKHKCENREFIAFQEFYDNLTKLLSSDKYIAKSDYLSFYDELKSQYDVFKIMKDNNVLLPWYKQNKIDSKLFDKYLDSYENIETIVDRHNESYINKHLEEDQKYLDNILKQDDPNIKLDDEQRKVVLSDEDYTLVVAGAGAGKTTTIEAKVKYLIDKQKIDPSKILVVSYTKKATNELRERFNKLNIDVNISTFHSTGNTLIKQDEQRTHKIVDNGFMNKVITEYLVDKLDNAQFIHNLLLFFASYLNMPLDIENNQKLFKLLNEDNITTLKSDISSAVDDYSKEITKKRITINNEKVRSNQECRIANFLFINGIDYVYEPVYRYLFENSNKPYCPDFLIKQGDKQIYLEHFGISEDGKNSRFSEEELRLYNKHIKDKIALHKKHNTKLIYTFSRYNDNRDLITHLRELLEKSGITLNSKEDKEIYQKIINTAESKYINKFVKLVCTFISKFKVNNFKPNKFDEWNTTLKDERTKLFIKICYECYLVYENALKANNSIDFEDMINNASNILDKYIEDGEMLPYEYIFVDEYQDISLQRFDLCEKLSKASNAKIVAVGDDWQSIFRFSGAKVDLFTHFKEKMGYANILKITKTYRNSQELIDIAGGFVMKNDKQIKKSLTSNKSISDPVILMSYDDTPKVDDQKMGPFYRQGLAIEKSLDSIVQTSGLDKSVLLIGRYHFDYRNLSRLSDLFYLEDNKIKSVKYPDLNLVSLTAHGSKGLGYDNVIIINGKDDVIGFPSKIEDDPVLKLVIKDNEEMEYSEERRLFYVALTRTKNRVYIVTPQYKPSKFILEIKHDFTNVILNGKELTPTDSINTRRKCPKCGYPLQRRKTNLKINATSLWICSNDPEVCGFMTNNLSGGSLSICKCKSCEDGYLIVKPVKNPDGSDSGKRFLGCTNYKKDGTGCNGTLYKENNNSIEFMDSNLKIDNIHFMGYTIKEVVNVVLFVMIQAKKKIKNFDFTIGTLKEFLCGEESKTIKTFKLNEYKYFGLISKEYHSYVFPFIHEMINYGILKVNKDNFNSLTILNPKPNNEILTEIFSILEK